jgi:hypothetical protein
LSNIHLINVGLWPIRRIARSPDGSRTQAAAPIEFRLKLILRDWKSENATSLIAWKPSWILTFREFRAGLGLDMRFSEQYRENIYSSERNAENLPLGKRKFT